MTKDYPKLLTLAVIILLIVCAGLYMRQDYYYESYRRASLQNDSLQSVNIELKKEINDLKSGR